jgi:thiamine biosynthesis protein ThiS
MRPLREAPCSISSRRSIPSWNAAGVSVVSDGPREAAGGAGLRLQVNGKERRVREGTNVRELLEELKLVPALVVVERNREIVERELYGRTLLEDGDTLELVHFVGGGMD